MSSQQSKISSHQSTRAQAHDKNSTASKLSDHYILTLQCLDQPGIVAAIAGCLSSLGCNIEQSSQFGDVNTGNFFMRVHFSAPPSCLKAVLVESLETPADQFEMCFQINPANTPMRVIIMVSKTDHCLNDLLYRWKIGTLPIQPARIISNHETLRPIAEAYDVPFSYLPVYDDTKPEMEAQLREFIARDEADLIILARYMQVLSDQFATDFFGRVINIHHSFLPGFKGAKPYHQAHRRGVKLIGATAHYITEELDEGPIIEQAIERVHHGMSVKDFINAGRDIERQVLSRAVLEHCEHRVFINGCKTVVFQ